MSILTVKIADIYRCYHITPQQFTENPPPKWNHSLFFVTAGLQAPWFSLQNTRWWWCWRTAVGKSFVVSLVVWSHCVAKRGTLHLRVDEVSTECVCSVLNWLSKVYCNKKIDTFCWGTSLFPHKGRRCQYPSRWCNVQWDYTGHIVALVSRQLAYHLKAFTLFLHHHQMFFSVVVGWPWRPPIKSHINPSTKARTFR